MAAALQSPRGADAGVAAPRRRMPERAETAGRVVYGMPREAPARGVAGRIPSLGLLARVIARPVRA